MQAEFTRPPLSALAEFFIPNVNSISEQSRIIRSLIENMKEDAGVLQVVLASLTALQGEDARPGYVSILTNLKMLA